MEWIWNGHWDIKHVPRANPSVDGREPNALDKDVFLKLG